MERQPAKVNYFFGSCYRDLGNTIANAFSRLWGSVVDQWDLIKDNFDDMRDDKNLGSILLFAIKLAYRIAVIISTVTVTAAVTLMLSLVHIVIVALIMTGIYLFFSLIWLLDTLVSRIRRIRSACPVCQRKFALPHYQCPRCGNVHTKLKPSKYGILKRECDCGAKLATTFFNGRQKLPAICPYCKSSLSGGGFQVNISIPVIGGPSAGKTCFVNMALGEIEKIAESELGYEFEYLENAEAQGNLRENLETMEQGYLPQKTTDMALVYYRFYFTEKKAKVRNQIDLCDVGGEVYSSSSEMNKQIGYGNANGYLMVIDPLTIEDFRKEFEKTNSASEYKVSPKPISEVLDILIKTVNNMCGLSDSKKITKNLAIVFTKCDMPLIEDEIGDAVVDEIARRNEKMTRMEARNHACEDFLAKYGEAEFINIVKSKFNNVQYFTCTALGHNVNGQQFVAKDVAQPILWLIDKQSPTIDFKKYWAKQ